MRTRNAIAIVSLSLLLLVAVVQGAFEGQITYMPTSQTFIVSFPKGADGACTVYKSLTETIEDEGKQVPYTPRHCWLFEDPSLTEYDDDWSMITANGGNWEVSAEVFYPQQGGTYREEVTNVLTVKH